MIKFEGDKLEMAGSVGQLAHELAKIEPGLASVLKKLFEED